MPSIHLRQILLAGAAVFAMVPRTHAETPKVVVTIKPIHSLVAGVMEGVARPGLLMTGGGSPHSYALRPSQARSLAEAALAVRVSEGLEVFLNRSIENLASGARILTLDETAGLTLFEARAGGLWKHHDNAHEHAERDPHLWLDPENAIRLTARIAGTLADIFPEHATAFAANAHDLQRRLGALDLEISEAIGPIKGIPYIVFHDAYRYFEEHYGLLPAGAVSVTPDRPPGARRLVDMREHIRREQAVCVFSEPQFQPRMVSTLIEGTRARRGTLDPLGAELAPGADLYFTLMRNLARNLKECLEPAS